MNVFALGLMTVALAFIVFSWVWFPVRTVRGRRDLRSALEERGYRVRKLQMHWLSGAKVLMHLPGAKPPLFNGLVRGELVYRAIVDDPRGNPRIAWIRWRARWPWQASDRWEIRSDDTVIATSHTS